MAQDPYTDGTPGWAAPTMSAGMAWRDVGSTGLRSYGGWLRDEYLRDLLGLQAARTYREMAQGSATIGAILFAITQSMRKIDWRVEPANDKPEGQEAADFAESLMHDMSDTWNDFLSSAFSMLPFGYAPHEIVYKRRDGKAPPRGEAKSSYNDGRIGWRRLALRSQDTILKWFFDQNGQPTGLTQQPWVGSLIDIPIEKLVIFRAGTWKNSPEGISILRTAYRPWFFQKRLEEQEAILFERMSGFPCMYVPNDLLEAAAAGDTNAIAAVDQYKRIVTNVRIDEQMGVLLPSDTYVGPNGPSTARMYEFQFVVPQTAARGGSSANVAIERYKLEIMTSVLADFLQLGHAARGTQSLAVSKVDLFYGAIEGWLNNVAAVLNRHALPRLWSLNGLSPDLMPEFKPDLAQRIDLDVLGNFIYQLAQAGMPLFPDPSLEEWVRDTAGMPDRPDEFPDVGDPMPGEQPQPQTTDPSAANLDISDPRAVAATGGGQDKAALKKMLAASLARRVRP